MTNEIARAIAKQSAQEVLYMENAPVVDGFVTSDATPTVMHTIELQDYEGGIVEIKCIGVTTTGVISAHLSASVLKQPGISLDYAGLISEKGFGPYGASADVEMVASAGYDIDVRVTGFAATDIVWTLWIYKNTRVAA